MACGARAPFDVVIGGAGLAGLTAAHVLSQRRPGLRLLLLEASAARLGGRIYGKSRSGIDLGPAWVWVDSQPAMRSLIQQLGLEEQLVLQAGGSDGEHRLRGGMSALVERLHEALRQRPEDVVVELGRRITEASQEANGVVQVVTQSSDGSVHMDTCKHLLLALPPGKVASEIVLRNCEEFLPQDLLARMKRQPVWMAPMGKLALYYEARFWDAEAVFGGVGGVRMSPDWYGAVQVYDAGQATDGSNLYALVAFVVFGSLLSGDGLRSEDGKRSVEQAMVKRTLEQLATTFSLPRQSLDEYARTEMHCWRADGHINPAVSDDNFPEHPRPIPGLNQSCKDRRIWFINTEASPVFTGMMEGAVVTATEGANRVLHAL